MPLLLPYLAAKGGSADLWKVNYYYLQSTDRSDENTPGWYFTAQTVLVCTNRDQGQY